MKFSLGGEQFIEFKTDVKGLHNVAPVKPAKHFIPQWFKDMNDFIVSPPNEEGPNFFGKNEEISKKFHNGTVKRCPAIVDLITEGFVIPMWCDFLVQRNDKLLEWDNKQFPYGIEFHGAEQITGFKLNKRDFPEAVKFTNPWRIYTPPGYSVMFLQPTYQFEKRFTVLPGIVETDSYHHINFPTIWHTNKDAIIERGTPFIQVIPFKRDEWKYNIGEMSEIDIENDSREKNELIGKFKNSYRSIVGRLNGRHNKRR